MFSTCGIGEEVEFWFVTNHVILNTTFADSVIYVDVDVELTLCYSPNRKFVPCSSNYFEVYVYRGNVKPNINPPPATMDFILSVFSSSIFNITNNTSPNATLTRSIQTFSFPQNNSPGVTFAVRSRGACGKIFRMKMYYYYCKETYVNGVKFEKTPSPAKGFKHVTGNCSEYAITPNGAASFNRSCYDNGTWSNADDNLKCFCIKGYRPNSGSCSSKLIT